MSQDVAQSLYVDTCDNEGDIAHFQKVFEISNGNPLLLRHVAIAMNHIADKNIVIPLFFPHKYFEFNEIFFRSSLPFRIAKNLAIYIQVEMEKRRERERVKGRRERGEGMGHFRLFRK